jgi:hypothetical protein
MNAIPAHHFILDKREKDRHCASSRRCAAMSCSLMASPPLPFFLSSPFPQTSRVSPKPCLARAAYYAASPPPPPPPTDDGVGPAAPTRGDRFIGRQLATEAAARVLAAQHAETRRRRKDKRQALATKQPSGLASCYGCGAPLQTEEDGAPGYVDPDTYQLVRFVLHLTSFLLLSIIHSLSLSLFLLLLPPEKEAPSTANSSMWKVQAALSWPYGHRCGGSRWLSWGQAVRVRRTAPGEAVVPPS